MNDDSRMVVSRTAAIIALLLVLAIGAGGTYLAMRARSPGGQPETGARDGAVPAAPRAAGTEPQSPSTGPAGSASQDVVVSLSKEALDRAGVRVTPVSTRGMAEELRLPGVVEPNAYRQVAVTPLVGGRVLRVRVQLGDRVRKGQPIAEIYSPELAEARTKYVAARAMLEAHDRELQRAQKLAEIGAASRQELERIHAEHAAQTAEVESARSRLQLLGAADLEGTASGQDVSATTTVAAPIDGVITERLANAGLNVDPTTRLFTIVDLSVVWIIADVYERDLSRVRDGAHVTVFVKAYPDRPLEGRVSYLDPQLSADTRTAKVRVEVPNPGGDLRLGMYTDVLVVTAGAASALSIPRTAIQSVGDRQVVYLPVADDPTRFVEREVRVGRIAGDSAEIVSGLSAGDSVVSEGSFFVRAEAERLGLRARRTSAAPAATRPSSGGVIPQAAEIKVTEKGFEPDRVTLQAGVPARITFLRTTDQTCAKEVVVPSLKVRRPLPLNQAAVIELTPATPGEIAFVCGMDMLKGALVVRQ